MALSCNNIYSLVMIVLCYTTTVPAVNSFSLRIPQNELHQILPLGANATVHCLPEPNISLPILSWTIDNSLSYDLHMAFYNSKGIKVHLTADNISYVLVEGRQENSVPGGRRFLCSTIDPDSNNPVVSDTAVVEFYGLPTVPNTLNVNVTISLSLLLSWQPSQGRNIKYELTASTTDTMNSSVNIVLTATSYVFNASSSIEQCIEYMFTVRAFNPAGSSNSSDTIVATLPDGPGEICDLQATVDITESTYSALITFSPTQCGHYPTNYTIQLVDQDNHTSYIPLNVTSLSMSPITAVINNLPADTSFTAVIIAMNAFGTRMSKPVSISTDGDAVDDINTTAPVTITTTASVSKYTVLLSSSTAPGATPTTTVMTESLYPAFVSVSVAFAIYVMISGLLFILSVCIVCWYKKKQNQEATKESVTVATNPPPVESSTTATGEQDQAAMHSSFNPMYNIVTGHIPLHEKMDFLSQSSKQTAPSYENNIEMKECQVYDVIT